MTGPYNTLHNDAAAWQWLLQHGPGAILQSQVLRPSLHHEGEAVQLDDVTLARVGTTLFTMPELNAFQARLILRRMFSPWQWPSTWRQVGDAQKALYRERLLKRVGHAPPGSTAPAFEFNSADWQNIFQLEALVEFYMNFDDPWLPAPPDRSGANVPRPPLLADGITPTPGYVSADLSTGWHLVVVDSFGGRRSGAAATINGNVVTLDGLPIPSKVNPNFDTIYLPGDTARASKTYRITAVDDARHTVTVDGRPVFRDESSRWHIPAGVSGQLPVLDYDLGPNGVGRRNGFDHFDGVMFIVKDGIVHGQYRWNSYTSRGNRRRQHLSSIRGNKAYDFRSFMSPRPNPEPGETAQELEGRINGAAFRNYNFEVRDTGAGYDGVREARFYFDTPVTADVAPANQKPNGGGKTVIRIHNSNRNRAAGCNSAGCIVSSDFYTFRNKMIDLYQAEYRVAHNDATDAVVQRLHGADSGASRAIWRRSVGLDPGPGDVVASHQWNRRIRGTLWLVRPDERPLG